MTSVLPPPRPIDPGIAGRARRDDDRREREARRLLGERRLGRRLDHEMGGVGIVLHDRQVVVDGGDPGRLGDVVIDHLVVAASGVWVVVADHRAGRVVHRRRADGHARLGVGHTDHGWALDAPRRHAEHVAGVIARIGFDWVDVHPALCFTNADWSVSQRPFRLDGVVVTHGRGLVDAIVGPGPLGPGEVRTIGAELSSRVPAAGRPAAS